MTPEFGAASQLEKIDMLDFADVVAINKFDRRGGEDALRDVRRQLARNRERSTPTPSELPVFGTIASRFNDDGVTALYQHLRERPRRAGPSRRRRAARAGRRADLDGHDRGRPADRARYLAEIADTVRGHHAETQARWPSVVRAAQRLELVRRPPRQRAGVDGGALPAAAADARRAVPADRAVRARAPGPTVVEQHRGRPSCCGRRCRARRCRGWRCPTFADDGDLVTFLRSENLPGRFPFTAGVFPFKREGEDPTRMFAGEGDAFRTNRRFHLLSPGQPATRLSTAFDSVTLYGFDPAERPDIYGKVGNAGVSIARSTT